MSGADFDKYVDDYRDIINRVSSISGEQFEFFIQLRLKLIKARIVDTPNYKEGLKILDFGCGTGTTEIYFKELFPNSLIIAVDSSAESIRAAQARNIEGVTFVHSEVFNLPFLDKSFDLIYSNGTFHHIEPTQHVIFISEMSRVCRDGGNLFIFENNPRNPLMMRAMRKNPFDVDANVVHPKWLLEIIESLDFTNKEVYYYFFFPRLLRLLRFTEKWLHKIPIGAQYFIWAIK